MTRELGYDRVPLHAAHSLRNFFRLVDRELPQVTQPLLLMRSPQDHVVPPADSARILSRVSSVDVTEVLLEQSYHVATLDYDAELIFREGAAFIGGSHPAPSVSPVSATKGRPQVAEHDSDREGREPEEQGVPFDEAAAWEAIVAGYGAEPPDPPGAKPFKSVEDLALLESETNDEDGAGTKAPPRKAEEEPPARPLGGSVAFAPGVGPRDYSVAEPAEEDADGGDESDEGHFVPPEPPPLPEADVTSKFAWLGVLGAPVLLLLAILLGWEMTWWLTTLCIGGFLGGAVTLVMRMRTDDEDDGDPGRGAVV